MSYQPLDIALDDLLPPPHTFADHLDDPEQLDICSISSETSVVFAKLSKAAASPIDPELSEDVKDGDRENGVPQGFPQKSQFLKKQCTFFGLGITLIWLLAVVVYSNINIKTAASLWRSKSSNVVAFLENREIVLNPYEPSRNNVTLDSYRKGKYRSRRVLARWLKPIQFPQTPTLAGRGFYLTKEKKSFLIRQVDSTYKQVLLESPQFAFQNNFIYAENLILNPGVSIDDRTASHLIVLDSIAQWRHSKFSLYWLWQPATDKFVPLRNPKEFGEEESELEKLHFAEFSPSGKFVVYGFEHDLYVVDLSTLQTKRVTETGCADIFNGKSDWVYEEEVNSSDKMIWWSPDLKHIAYASLNDTLVQNYSLDYYTNPSEVVMSYDEPSDLLTDGLNQYPHHLKLKYPKPGSNNPLVSIHLYNIDTEENFEVNIANIDIIGHDFVLYDALWIDERHFMMKAADRTSTIEQKQVYVLHEDVKLVSSYNATSFGGWIEKSSPIALVSESDKPIRYLDRVVVDNVVKLALFDNATSPANQILLPVTLDTNLVYDNIEHAVYGVFGTDLNLTFGVYDLKSGDFNLLTNLGKYKVDFSPDGGFVNLMYMGPNEPWQKLFNMGLLGETGLNINETQPIDDVKHLSSVLKDTNLPTHIRSKVDLGSGDHKVSLNIMEIFPPNFQEGKKYPLLVHAYGGPGSVTIDGSFNIDFQDVVSAELNAIVLIVEPRGTGKDDWKVKTFALKNIGFWEPRDVTAITKKYVKTTGFVDEEKTAIWGWSYGGFTTLKTLEYDKGETFKYGMAVAPVTNWMFYDSIYTERYMKLPSDNKNYANARIMDFNNFASVNRFLIMHGTADDNVHVQNTMWLLDNFNVANIENYDVHFFPDSEHSIYHHNANKIVYDKLLWWLQKAFMGIYV